MRGGEEKRKKERGCLDLLLRHLFATARKGEGEKGEKGKREKGWRSHSPDFPFQ